ncbi:MAG: hypothetical protein JWN30_2828 [Bacilli bacterium]|nr:hypothetical protein [Bacilli bacterium]
MVNTDAQGKRIAIVRNLPNADSSSEDSIEWALTYLADLLKQQDVSVIQNQSPNEPPDVDLCILIENSGSRPTRYAHLSKNAVVQNEPEAFCMISDTINGQKILAVAGSDVRGLLYAILELADRVKYADDPWDELTSLKQLEEKPATKVRSINRIFASEIEDKPWFYNKEFWTEYLTELATHRFNKLHLALGMGYDYGHDPGVKDNYFCFAYPFLVSVPGYKVTAKGLKEGEAERNLTMLQFISKQAKLRGIHFQLGLWTHAFDPSESPDADYVIEGVHPGNHAAYCRDAVQTLLQACPAIDGITFRIHYESGIPEPAHEFWREVFSGVTQSGRIVEIDLHSKGADDQMIQIALDTGMPVIVSPKYWAEHMGLPYHQAAIRRQELPAASTDRADLMAITATSRRFTRYGYADYLKEERPYGILFRLWPGTQRVLLWGDPTMAAAYARSSSFSGSLGVDLCEPLSFKARKGSGTPGGRDPYAESSLKLDGNEWLKYVYYYRLWGRLLYNPEAEPSSWQRYLQKEFGDAAQACEISLAHASRILPLVTTAHLPSAANNIYWPEMYANMAIVRKEPSFYDGDTGAPYTFTSVSPLDPVLFYSIDDFVKDVLEGRSSGKYSPVDVSKRLLQLADTAEQQLVEAASTFPDVHTPAFRRLAVDIAVQVGLGRFFARKLLAGLAYALFECTEDMGQLEEALKSYRLAKTAWEQVSSLTSGIYSEDITFGYKPYMRGHWADRLPAIAEDLAAMEQIYEKVRSSAGKKPSSSSSYLFKTRKDQPDCVHIPPDSFRKGQSIELQVSLPEDRSDLQVAVHYRHVNQVESYCTAPMNKNTRFYTATIPGSYTDSSYPLVYFFELKDDRGHAWLFPGLAEDLSNQPYFLLRQQQ